MKKGLKWLFFIISKAELLINYSSITHLKPLTINDMLHLLTTPVHPYIRTKIIIIIIIIVYPYGLLSKSSKSTSSNGLRHEYL